MATLPLPLAFEEGRCQPASVARRRGDLARLLQAAAGWARPAVVWIAPRRDGGVPWHLPHRPGARGALSDKEGFEQLYFRIAQRSLVFLTRRTADPEIAADLWGETWARAYEARDRYRGATPAEQEGWLFGIARNVLAGYYKRGNAEQRAMHRLGLERPSLDDADLRELERLAGLNELRDVLGEVLRELSREQREALALRIVRGLPYDEVASEMGVSEQTARARVSRGLRALTKALERSGIDLVDPA